MVQGDVESGSQGEAGSQTSQVPTIAVDQVGESGSVGDAVLNVSKPKPKGKDIGKLVDDVFKPFGLPSRSSSVGNAVDVVLCLGG